MSEFKIEKNVPLPVTKVRTKFRILYEMEKGDSFEFPSEYAVAVRSMVGSIHTRNPDIKFSVQRTGESTFRCWRVE